MERRFSLSGGGLGSRSQILDARRLHAPPSCGHGAATRRHPVTPSAITRRTLIQHSGAALTGLSVLRVAGPAHAFPHTQHAGVTPWLDQPEPNPEPEAIARQLEW